MSSTINFSKVQKRSGSMEEFNETKIINAIRKALDATLKENSYKTAESLTGKVLEKLKSYGADAPSVEVVQDLVEAVLIENNYADTAKAYIVYRHEHKKIRDEKCKLLDKKELDEVDKALDMSSLRVLEKRYLLRDAEGKLSEGPKQLFQRVATLVGISDILHDDRIYQKYSGLISGDQLDWRKQTTQYLEKLDNFNYTFKIGKYQLNKFHFEALIKQYNRLAGSGEMKVSFKHLLKMIAEGDFASYEERIDEYFNLMVSLDFLPNTPTLMNAGAKLGQLSACFVLDMPDDMASIMETATDSAMIFKSGGGVGINYSKLRHEGDMVASTSGVSSGPTSFMNIINVVADVVKQGGCISVDSLIRTDGGLRQLGTMLNAPPLMDTPLMLTVQNENGYSLAYTAQDNGSTEVYKLQTELGTEIKATYNHQIMTIDKSGQFVWKTAMDIQPGDWLVHVIGDYQGEDQFLPNLPAQYHFNTKIINVPRKLNESLGEMLGFYMGNGYKHDINHKIAFSINADRTQTIDWVKGLMRNLFSLEPTLETLAQENNNSIKLEYQSRLLYDWLKMLKCLKPNSPEAFIPEIILRASRPTLCAFLRGLFEADGSVGLNNHTVNFSTTSPVLANHVQQALLGLGIIATRSIRKKGDGSYGKRDAHVVTIRNKNSLDLFKQEIGFISKNEKLAEILPKINNSSSDIMPNQEIPISSCYTYVGAGTGKGRSKRGANSKLYRKIGDYIHGRKQLTRQRLLSLMTQYSELNTEHFRKLSDRKYVYSKVESKTNERAYTGDLEVPESSSFVANSILVHNKRRAANMGILEAWHPDIEKFITMKSTPGVMENFNVSVGMSSDFWQALVENKKYMLKSPRTGAPVKAVDARQMLDMIALSAWKSAEPGVLFFDNFNKNNPFIPIKGFLDSCNPCVTGETLLATENGWTQIKDVVNTETKVYYQDGENAVKPKGIALTREEADIYSVEFTNGMKIRCTKDHPLLTDKGMIELKDLKAGNKVKVSSFPAFGKNGIFDEGSIAGWVIGDGYVSDEKAVLDFYGEKQILAETYAELVNSIVPDGSGLRQQYIVAPVIVKERNLKSVTSVRLGRILRDKFGITENNKLLMNPLLLQTSKEFQKGFLQAIFSADGSVNVGKHGRQVNIKVGSVSTELLRMIQLMLSNFNVKSVRYLRKKAQRKLMPDGKGGQKEYDCQPYYELYISNNSIETFMKEIGFSLQFKTDKINEFIKTMSKGFYGDKQFTKIKSIAYDGREPVYDVIETPNHQIGVAGIITSQCGEQALYPYESCNLGSINLANFVKKNTDGIPEFDWARYEQAVRLSTRFLDNIVDMNKYPVEEIDKESRDTRRIGLGIMGIADALFLLRMPYNSQEGYETMNQIAEALSYYSMEESVNIARARGAFPLFPKTDYVKGVIPVAGYYELPKSIHQFDWDALVEIIKLHGIRNSWTSTIAPTGTLSMLADCSNGVEPVFAAVYEKKVTVGRFLYANKILEAELKARNLYTEEILTKIQNNYGSLRGIEEIPEDMQRIFVTAMDIHWVDHVYAQAVWQKWISNAIAKTINMAGDATAEDVKCSYLLAHELGLKGMTVYRDGSRHEQVLHIVGENDGKKKFEVTPSDYVKEQIGKTVKEPYVTSEMAKVFGAEKTEAPHTFVQAQAPAPAAKVATGHEKDCPTCKTVMINSGGCNVCIECGFSGCSVG